MKFIEKKKYALPYDAEVPIHDTDPENKRQLTCLVSVREGEFILKETYDGRYGCFGDLNAVQAKFFYGLAYRLTTDRMFLQEHQQWLLAHAAEVKHNFYQSLEEEIKKNKQKHN